MHYVCDFVNLRQPSRSPAFKIQTESVHTELEPNMNDRQSPNIFSAENDGIQAGIEPTHDAPVNSDICMQTREDPNTAPDIDLSNSIKGMYRILDLVSEQGSGGLGKIPFTFCAHDTDVIGSR
jgi:hypothetical protein